MNRDPAEERLPEDESRPAEKPRPEGRLPARATYPTKRLLLSVVSTAAALFVLWLMLGVGAGLTEAVIRGGVLGLLSATASHLLGTLAGERFSSIGSGPTAPLSAYLASSTLRFICTPAFAVSLYFALPQAPAPLLIGAAAGHALIMIVDVSVLLKAQGGAGSRPTPGA
ncbi:MAG: hypothetical protein GC172_07385 [Phycisphaera sp.]|nr:hypothetical protein [Phycisphaera sp.]